MLSYCCTRYIFSFATSLVLLSLICLSSLITDENEVLLSKAVYYQKSTLISLCHWCCVNQPSFKRYKCERKRNGHQLCHVIGGIKSFCWLHQNYMWKIVRVVQNVLSLHMIIIREHNLLTAEWFPQINVSFTVTYFCGNLTWQKWNEHVLWQFIFAIWLRMCLKRN